MSSVRSRYGARNIRTNDRNEMIAVTLTVLLDPDAGYGMDIEMFREYLQQMDGLEIIEMEESEYDDDSF